MARGVARAPSPHFLPPFFSSFLSSFLASAGLPPFLSSLPPAMVASEGVGGMGDRCTQAARTGGAGGSDAARSVCGGGVAVRDSPRVE